LFEAILAKEFFWIGDLEGVTALALGEPLAPFFLEGPYLSIVP
jgi:hypothetical protein